MRMPPEIAAQQSDRRLQFSGASFACIITFVIFAGFTAMVRGWKEARSA